jgi:hypothetical protein
MVTNGYILNDSNSIFHKKYISFPFFYFIITVRKNSGQLFSEEAM